jgi:hypothetical protein
MLRCPKRRRQPSEVSAGDKLVERIEHLTKRMAEDPDSAASAEQIEAAHHDTIYEIEVRTPERRERMLTN